MPQFATIDDLNKAGSSIKITPTKHLELVSETGEMMKRLYPVSKDSYSFDEEGISIENPKENIELLLVTPEQIRIDFNEDVPLNEMIDLFVAELNSILDILDIKKIARAGWINNFAYEFEDPDEQEKYFNHLSTIKDIKLLDLHFAIPLQENFKVHIALNRVVKTDSPKVKGVLFGVNIYEKRDISLLDLKATLNSFHSYITNNDKLLAVINNTFSDL